MSEIRGKLINAFYSSFIPDLFTSVMPATVSLHPLRSGGKTILCSRCEALIVVTNHNLKEVELSASDDIMIMLKEPHLIRKVTY
jgi:hypothetical protein